MFVLLKRHFSHESDSLSHYPDSLGCRLATEVSSGR